MEARGYASEAKRSASEHRQISKWVECTQDFERVLTEITEIEGPLGPPQEGRTLWFGFRQVATAIDGKLYFFLTASKFAADIFV